MTKNLKAILDAADSRLSWGKRGEACIPELVIHELWAMFSETQRPSTIFKPSIGLDGNQWCALYGPNLQEGVAGFGESPALALVDFDTNWNAKIGATNGN
jgi:hypothetical protein